MSEQLSTIVCDFAKGFMLADSKKPQAVNHRTKDTFKPGIGPHSEADTTELVLKELEVVYSNRYLGRYALGVPYPENKRLKCDLCIGHEYRWDWSIEVKMIRFLGDNGKLNDNILMHVLSPYPSHRSALTDCQKLLDSKIGGKKAILIFGYDHSDWLLDPAIEAFEVLAAASFIIGDRYVAEFNNLIHPIHDRGRVFAWELIDRKDIAGRVG